MAPPARRLIAATKRMSASSSMISTFTMALRQRA
jgi:hypothetical protein